MGQVAQVPPEAPLSRTDDRRNLLIALGAAGVTLAVALGIIGIPMIDACSADPRGVITCLRDMADRKFDLPGTIPGRSAESGPAPVTEHAEPNVVVDLPPPVASPDLQATVTGEIPGPVPAQSMVVAETPEPADPTPAVVPPVEMPPVSTVEPQPAAVELATAPETPAIPPTAPAAGTSVDTALTWTAPPPADLGPPPAAPMAAETTEEAAATPNDPLPIAAAPPPAFAPEPTIAEAAPPKPALLPAVPPGTTPPAPSTHDVANAEPARADAPSPAVAAPLVLSPTIDAIELEGAASYVSGSGPAGALMRLYADGELIGESPVEEGRWLVEGRNLLDSPRSELRVEAIEPETGKLLGFAAITVEIELPNGGTPPDERPVEPPEFGSSVVSNPGPEASAELPEMAAPPPAAPVTSEPAEIAAAPEPTPIVEPETPAAAEPQVEAAPIEPDPIVVPGPLRELAGPLAELAAVTPLRESASVEILAPPESEPTVLPPIGTIDHEPATLTLDPPEAPALIADLVVPEPQPPGQPVKVLRLLPFGDPESGRYNIGKAIIRHGDTLWSIARRYYGHGIHYRTIFHANRDLIRRPSRIFPGQIFDLPLVTDD